MAFMASITSIHATGGTVSWSGADAGGRIEFIYGSGRATVNNVAAAGTYMMTGLTAGTTYSVVVTHFGGSQGVVRVFLSFTPNAPTPVPPPVTPGTPGTPGRIMPGMLRYVIVRADATTVDVSRQVTLAKLSFGTNLEEQLKFWVKSTGEININDWRDDYTDDIVNWRRVNIYAGTVLVFACSIISVGEYGAYSRLRIFIELLGAANLPGTQVKVSTGLTDATLSGYLTSSGLKLARVPGVTLPAMHVAGGWGYRGEESSVRDGASYTVFDRFEDGGSKFIDDVASFGSLFFFERARENSFRAFPLSAIGADSRTPLSTVTSAQLVRRGDYKAEFEDYRRDHQIMNEATPASEVKSGGRNITLSRWFSGRYAGGHTRRSPFLSYADIMGSGHAKALLSLTTVSTQEQQSRSRRLYTFNFPDRNGIQVYSSGDPAPSTRIRVSYSGLFRSDVTISQRLIVGTDADGDIGALATSSIPIPVSGANSGTSRSAVLKTLNKTKDLLPEIISLTQLLPQGGDLSALLREPGDLVDIRAAGAEARCLLAGVEFQHRGLQALELRWHCLSYGPIPQAGGIIPPDPTRVTFGGVDVTFPYEGVHFG